MPATALSAPAPSPDKGVERIHDNIYWRGAAPRISICIPTYRHDVTQLMGALADCASSSLSELIVHDDGSGDTALAERIVGRASYTLAAIRVAFAEKNRGRAAARNAAMRHARADWILLLDADMMPDDAQFLERYLDTIDTIREPAVVVGGHSLRTSPRDKATALHRWQSLTSGCMSAEARSTSAGRLVFSSNVLLHRRVLERAPFDESFAGWGWEDTDWGLRAQKWFPVLHIDNTATHLGLDTDESLMRKYASSVDNFRLLTRRHPQEAMKMPLYRMARRFRLLPFRRTLTALAAACARSRLLPLGLRGRALTAWRALIHAGAL